MAFLLGECLLLQLIDKKGWSQAEFARRMKCSRSFVTQLISGESYMSLEFAINAAHLLELVNVKAKKAALIQSLDVGTSTPS